MDGVALIETHPHRWRTSRLHPIDPQRWLRFLERHEHSRYQSAAADRNHDNIEMVDLLEQLEGCCARAGADDLIVERMNERESAIVLELARAAKRLTAVLAMEHDLGAIFAARVDL